MNILGKNGLGKFLKIFLIILFIFMIPGIALSPFFLQHTRKVVYSMFIIYPNGILLLGVVYEFIKLFRSLEDSNPFNFSNVKTLNQTSLISFLISVLWFIDLLFMVFIIKNFYINYVIVLIFLSLLFLGVSISLYILAELFKKATVYKEENDLTI